MLSFAEKQMSPQGLRKFAAELLKTSRPLTDEEMGISTSETPKQNHHRGSHHGHHGHRHYQEDAQPGPRLVSTSLRLFFIFALTLCIEVTIVPLQSNSVAIFNFVWYL